MTDWTDGAATLSYAECRGCGHRWYLPRECCPRCGSAGPARVPSSGTGTVAAITTVHRAPPGGPHPAVPFHLCLVDLDEGPRVMGRAASGLAVGDRVAVTFPDAVPEFARA